MKSSDGVLALEQPLIKVPLEQFKRAFKASQKNFEKELTAVGSAADALSSRASHSPVGVEEAIKTLDGVVTRLQSLKRKLKDSKADEAQCVQRNRARLDHLNEVVGAPNDSQAYERWNKTRLDRILVDYMLRQGYLNSAVKLSTDSHVEQLVDIQLFAQTRKIEDALRRQSCVECLQWCKDNGSSLKKLKSKLEFNLRLQEYIELVRARKFTEAIAYLRKWIQPYKDQFMKEISLASVLFDSSRWEQLIDQFRADNYALNSLASQPLLRTSLQAGLTALKTPMCYEPSNKNINCPVCEADLFGVLAEKLPNAHHLNSCLVCRISGRIMNEDNPPMVLPNGYVYSLRRKWLPKMAE
ncbi:GID complex subunit containing RING finger motif [Irineochytrium annulatum]|nr:GID complex subunit containing RING finger motif [Irineochytrium annulatum]